VYADNLQSNLKDYNQKLTTVKQQASQQAVNQTAAVQQAQSLQASAALLQSAVSDDTQVIQGHKTTISDLQDKQKVLTEKRQEEVKSLGDYFKAEYEKTSSPAMSGLQFLLRADSLGNLITRVSQLEDITGAYHKLAVQIEADTKALDESKKAEQATLDTLEQAIQSKLLMQNSLNSALAKQNQVVASLNADSQKLLSSRSSLQKDVDDTQNLIATQEMEARNAQQAPAKQSPSSNSRSINLAPSVNFSGSASQIINYAETFLGLPYVFGGSSPTTGFDCSSFVQYSFAHFGINLPRVTWDQYNQGSPVSKDNLQAGDLVFFSTYQPGPSHVGIYIGNGMMIDDENRGVVFSSINNSYYANKFVGGRRILN